MRKGVAKVLTILTENRRDAAREAHKKDKYTPKDLRFKRIRSGRFEVTMQNKSQQGRQKLCTFGVFLRIAFWGILHLSCP